MKKIISLFQRNYETDRLVRNEVVPGAEWVLAGEGVPTRKFDGTCCAVIGGKLYKRLEWDAKKGEPPKAWLHWDFDSAQRSGHGWMPVDDGPSDWMHRKAWERGVDDQGHPFKDGTYELCGPKMQKGVEHFAEYVLVPHGRDVIPDAPRTLEELRVWFVGKDIEGIVWHHPDGRMVKIKAKDFGIKRS